MAISVVSFSFSRVAQLGAWGPSSLLCTGFLNHILSPNSSISKLTDFLSSPIYIIVQSPTQYQPITGRRNVSLPPSLEWHVWSSSSGNNCHVISGHSLPVHQSMTVPWDFNPVQYCQPRSPMSMEYALPPSLEWHALRGRRSIYNNTSRVKYPEDRVLLLTSKNENGRSQLCWIKKKEYVSERWYRYSFLLIIFTGLKLLTIYAEHLWSNENMFP